MQRPLCRWLDRPLQRLLSLFLLFCFSAIVISCTAPAPTNSPQARASPIAPAAIAKPLNVAIIPWISPEEQGKRLQLLTNYLQKTLNRPINFQIAKDYDTAVDLVVQEKAEIGFLGPLSYIKARERNGKIEPIVVPIDGGTGRPWYTSLIVVDGSKEIQTLQDLKGKRFGFVSPSSTSGFLVPLNQLQAQGIDPSRDFAGIRYLVSHDKAATALALGEVDAIAIERPAFERAQTTAKLPKDEYKVIWESEPIPTGPMVLNTSKFTPEEITKLRQALIDAPIGITGVAVSNSTGYTLAKDADFEPLRQVYLRLKSITIAEK